MLRPGWDQRVDATRRALLEPLIYSATSSSNDKARSIHPVEPLKQHTFQFSFVPKSLTDTLWVPPTSHGACSVLIRYLPPSNSIGMSDIVSVFEAVGAVAGGRMSEAQLLEVERTAIPGPGSAY